MPGPVGRELAFEVLGAAWSGALEGRGGLVSLTGAAGAGRTAVLDAFAARVRRADTEPETRPVVVRIGVLPSDVGSGLDVIRRVVLALLAREGSLVDGGAASWASPLIEPGSGEVDHIAVSLGAIAILERVADATPVLVAIDDVHRADGASLRVLADIVVAARSLGVLVAASASSASMARAETGTGVAELLRRGREVALGALEEAAVAELCRSVLGTGVSQEVVSEVHRLTGGLPGLAVPLLEACGDEEVREPRRLAALAVPTLPTTVEARLGEVDAIARRLAEASAVLPTGSSIEVLARVAAIAPSELAAAIEALVDHGLFVEGGGVRWRSPLLATAVRTLVPPGRAGTLVIDAARACDEMNEPASTIASLLLDAPPVGEPWAARALAQAAVEAEQRGAPESAKVLWQRQLGEPMDVLGRGWATAGVARAELRLGQPEGLERLLALAATIDDPGLRARALFAAGRAALWQGRAPRAAAAFASAAREAGDVDDALWRRALAGELLALGIGLEDPQRRRRAVDSLPTLGDDAATSSIQGALALAWVLDGEPDRGAAAARDALGDERLTAPESSDNTAIAAAAAALASAGWPSDAVDPLDRLLDRARNDGQASTVGTVEATRAAVLLATGRLQEASEAAEASLASPHANPVERSTAASVLAEVCCLGGDLAGAHRALAAAEPVGGIDAVPSVLGELRWIAASARVALAEADPDRALQFVAQARRCEADLAVVRLAEVEVVATALAGRRAEACTLAAALASRCVTQAGPARARAASLQAWLSDDVGVARDAAEELAVADDPIGAVEAWLRVGDVLERAGRRREARDSHRRALDLAEHVRAGALASQAVDGLRRVGGRLRRRVLVGVDSLTPAELRVCRLAAQGRSNREVADLLFVSRKTVEYHLGNAYAKLAIDRRDDLAGAIGETLKAPAGAHEELAQP